MKIKSINIVGFKSFLDKTSLTFFPGITAMVGPNGCGKSNVADAIRWALGEQSAKHLRGSMMEDVIFNGSKHKKPTGMAEVSLTFSNENGNGSSQYKNFSEIQVTRRLFRSGESEYYINKTPCRLKDINELFMDTGVGTKAYSIIEQGRVDSIINSKPTDLRLLIEEAAGISKYKARKQEALRKMDATRQNLLRVNDVLGEIQKQINSLKYQTQKLKRFNRIKEKIRALELASAAKQYGDLAEKELHKENELQQGKEQQALFKTQIDSINARIVTKKASLQQTEEAFAENQKNAVEVKFSIQQEDNILERQQEKIRDLERQRLQAIETITENSLRLRQEEDEIAQSKTIRRSLEEKRSQAQASLINEEGEVTALKDTYESIRSDLERSREDLFEVRYEVTRRKNHIDHLEQTCSDCRRRLEQNREESRGENRQLEELKRENIDISAELEMQSRQKSVLEEDRDVLQNKISETEKESRENALTISALKEKQTRLESQLESLQNLHDTFEGYSEGVRSIMAKKAAVEKSPDGIEGVVADIIETEPSLERAVEAILGEKLQFMLVKNQNEGIEAIQYLKTEALGRGTFVPMNNAKPSLFEGQPTSASFVGATPLMEKMRVREGCEPLIRYLLGDVFLVDDLSQALALWKTDTLNHTFVTVGGDIVDPLGIITGGANSGDGNGLLGKRREIEELKEKVASATDQWQFFLNKQNEIDRLLEDNRNSLISVQEQLVQLKLSLQNRERDLHQNQEGISRVERKIEFLLLENEKVTGELAELEEDLRTSRCELEDLEIRESELGKTFSSLQEKENDHREKIESQEKQFHQCKIDSMEIQARISSLTSAIELREKALENGRNEISRCDRICQESEKETEALKISIARAHERLNSMSREYQEYQDKVNHLETALSEERDSLLEEEGILKATQQSLNDLQPLIQEIDHELNVLLSQKRYLEEKIGSKYHLSLKDAAEQGSPEDHHGEDEGDQLERLEQIRDRMMEEINFNAQKEYEEQIEKYQFYQSQSEDLRQSLDSLQEAIQKINRTSRERFRNTFHQVNENFTKLLPLVFEGGQGELRLTDEHDLLETGVEIMVRPIGKQLKNINLLSGGEKALSALTLLFSLYLFKPSPFCLLDEVDSPLDDANIGRFITILKEFSSNSQFIIITHNKNTMEIADNLYGITMEEPGVSKIVSVSLN